MSKCPECNVAEPGFHKKSCSRWQEAEFVDRLWDEVNAQFTRALPNIKLAVLDPPPGIMKLAERRFRENSPAHKYQWLDADQDWFSEMAEEELADLIVYLMMARVPKGRRRDLAAEADQFRAA